MVDDSDYINDSKQKGVFIRYAKMNKVFVHGP